MGKAAKKYEELTIVDDFMFGKVMRNPGRCRKLLEIILGVRISEIVFIDDQESITPDYNAKGIRLDVYVEDGKKTVYNVEMQVENGGYLPRRSRYYQSVIDINLLEKGTKYGALKTSYVIFICMFDLFGQGRYIYHFENLCREDPALRLGDGTEKIFLNVNGNLEEADEDTRNLLEYFRIRTPRDSFTEELEAAVMEAREHKEWRHEFMKLTLWQQDIMEEARKEGLEKGREEGLEKGREEGLEKGLEKGREEGLEKGREEGMKKGMAKGLEKGEMKRLVNQVCRKMAKGKTPAAIAEELEEDTEEVRRICDLAAIYAPDYDSEKVFEKLTALIDSERSSTVRE